MDRCVILTELAGLAQRGGRSLSASLKIRALGGMNAAHSETWAFIPRGQQKGLEPWHATRELGTSCPCPLEGPERQETRWPIAGEHSAHNPSGGLGQSHVKIQGCPHLRLANPRPKGVGGLTHSN